jgi:ABC-2 type transport system ATP-binding protein
MGMRQRLALAVALLGDPDVLILDEPTNGLDPPGIRWVRDLVRAQAERGRAVLISSHLLSEVAQSVDDVVVIASGTLRAHGPIDAVLGVVEERVTLVRTDAAERLRALIDEQSIVVERDGSDALLVHGASPELVGAIAAEHRIALVELRLQERSLEDAFLALTGSEP